MVLMSEGTERRLTGDKREWNGIFMVGRIECWREKEGWKGGESWIEKKRGQVKVKIGGRVECKLMCEC